MAISYGSKLVNNGLALHLDAANPKSYPGSGTVWSDLSENNNNGSVIGSQTFLDNGFRFSNDATWLSGGYTDISNSSSLNNITTFTLSFCIYSLGTQSGNGGSVFHKGNESTVGFICEPISNTIRVNYGNGSSWSWSTNQVSLTHNTFAIYDYVYDGTNLTIYKNSEQILSNAATIAWDNTNVVRIGRRRGHLGHYLYGSIFYERLYSRALSQTEIEKNFNALRGRFGL
jgi:hypothetical protein